MDLLISDRGGLGNRLHHGDVLLNGGCCFTYCSRPVLSGWKRHLNIIAKIKSDGCWNHIWCPEESWKLIQICSFQYTTVCLVSRNSVFETGVDSTLAKRPCLKPNAITAARWHLNEFKEITFFSYYIHSNSKSQTSLAPVRFSGALSSWKYLP